MKADRTITDWLPLLAVALSAMALYAAAFFPGTIPFDSAYQWWQARGGETTDIHGIGMTWFWRLSDAATKGPEFLFVLQLVLFWCGLTLVALSLPVRRAWRVFFMLVAGLAPVPLVVLGSVVSDATMMGLLSCAFGISVRALGRGRREPFLIVMALLFAAVTVRRNALPAAIPLAIYACWFEFSVLRGKPALAMLAGLCAALAMQGADALLEHRVDRPQTVFAGTAVWDLSAMSIASGEVLLPPSIHGPGLDVADLRQAFEPYSNVSIFARTHADMMQPFFDPDDPRNDEIRRAWLDAIMRHPRDYLAHRWRLTRALFGSKQPDWPRELVYFPGNTQYKDNPPIATNDGWLHAATIDVIERARAGVFLAAWPYVLLASVAAFVAWRRRESLQGKAALAVLASGLLYAAPLPLIAPSAELRYLAWTCLAAVLGAALAFTANPLTSAARATTLRAP